MYIILRTEFLREHMSMEISQNVTLGKTILLIIQTYIIFIFNLFFSLT